MQKHIAKLRMKIPRYRHWKDLGSQAVQEVSDRYEKTYQRFFAKQGRLPRFRKVKKYRSFTLKQASWKLEDETPKKRHRKLKIGKTTYKMVYHRPLRGEIKTVTIKRDSCNRLWVCFSVIERVIVPDVASTGKIGGFDFGLRTFLTADNGQTADAPLFYRADLPRMRRVQSHVSKKVKGSRNRVEGQRHIARRQIRIADKRRDWHYQLAHDLCDIYDVMVFEDLNIAAMKRLWGRKVSDLGFAQFMDILKWVAWKRGKRIIQIDRWERTTGLCSACGHRQNLELSEREFKCGCCGIELDRDHNAARNIVAAGHRRLLSQSEEDQASNPRSASGVNVRSPRLYMSRARNSLYRPFTLP